jgi:dGTPase
MAPYGGFDHNAQAIRIVTDLERHYADFNGLNLTWDTLEGIAKHNGPVDAPLPWALGDYAQIHDLELTTHASAEAQLAAIADDIAYNHHDLHDGLRAGLFTMQDLHELPILRECFKTVAVRHPGLAPSRQRHEVLRRFFGVLVEDVIATTRAGLASAQPATAQDIRNFGRPLALFSDAVFADLKIIRAFLFNRMYRAPSVVDMRAKVSIVVDDLFAYFIENPQFLPQDWHDDIQTHHDQTKIARHVCDYISGMTDRFAFQCHEKFIQPPVR